MRICLDLFGWALEPASLLHQDGEGYRSEPLLFDLELQIEDISLARLLLA